MSASDNTGISRADFLRGRATCFTDRQRQQAGDQGNGRIQRSLSQWPAVRRRRRFQGRPSRPARCPAGPAIIKNAEGTPVWDLSTYSFLGTSDADDAPDTVNPSLWRMAKLNMIHGLFEVVDGVYQARGYDLSVMSVIRTDTGYIVIDPLVSAETASAVWKELVIPKLGDKTDRRGDL
ncbi:alkyl/aryl-sulfatase BDS1 [Ditylenchus destructor]|uniref:Alkyl/aryl-sulfatase BDS1 n=1 Tax=Ditylenchus destructor TaxID=166010 RepID=A0AAD4ME41_9BILA|nr:alkyl/aryl-sulfatase BDS1 [Ditylenchus destructor]